VESLKPVVVRLVTVDESKDTKNTKNTKSDHE
jgi:hypothetical protein